MGRDDQLSLAAHPHRTDAFVPPLDHPAAPDRKLEGLTSIVRRVELLPALEPARVVHADRVTRLRSGSGALDDLDVAEPGGGLDDLLVHGERPPLLGSYRQHARPAYTGAAVLISSRRRRGRSTRTW